MTDEPMLTVRQVAQMLKRDRTTVHRIPREALPYIQTVGGTERAGHRRYRIQDVRAYLRNTTPSPDLEARVADLEQRVTRLESQG